MSQIAVSSGNKAVSSELQCWSGVGSKHLLVRLRELGECEEFLEIAGVGYSECEAPRGL
jgi:hypothetical protein